MKKFLTITIPAIAVTMIVIAALVEVWIRATWDPMRGHPGFLIADVGRFEKLAPNFDGWFAGVPVHTNSLGFRDDREYQLEKRPGTFRIIVLGDSVTFGHGSVPEHAYPRLLEQRLKAWKPDVNWQVWNLGVPGYNTSQELAYLLEVGPAYRPDLVVVGFYGNDLVDNRPPTTPTRKALAANAVKTWFKRRLYSFDVYKKAYLTLGYRLRASDAARGLLENLAAEDRLLVRPSQVAALKEQQLTDPAPMTDTEFAAARCSTPVTVASPIVRLPTLEMLRQSPEVAQWKAAVARLQQLHRDGTYRIAFFINNAPVTCAVEDVFDTRATRSIDEYFLEVLSAGTPAVSSHDAFARYRPSQMPEAAAHAIGNANALKAKVLFEFLRDRVLPPL